MKLGAMTETIRGPGRRESRGDPEPERRAGHAAGADRRPAAQRPQRDAAACARGRRGRGRPAATGDRAFPGAVAISVAGGTGNSTQYLVDGGYNNDPQINTGQRDSVPGRARRSSTESGVRDARFGMSTGATVNAVTKSGTNAFHGNVFDFVRDHQFNSIRYFEQDGKRRPRTRRRAEAASVRRHDRRADHARTSCSSSSARRSRTTTSCR